MSIVSSSPILTFLSDFIFFGLTSHSCLHMRGATTSEQTNESLPFISMDFFYKKRGNRNKNRRQRSVCGFDHEGSARKKQSCVCVCVFVCVCVCVWGGEVHLAWVSTCVCGGVQLKSHTSHGSWIKSNNVYLKDRVSCVLIKEKNAWGDLCSLVPGIPPAQRSTLANARNK